MACPRSEGHDRHLPHARRPPSREVVVVAAVLVAGSEVDELALARIDREREAATRKLAQTRDVVAWQAAMSRLDAAEALARQPLAGGRLTPPEIVAYLRSLPALWADSGPDARQAITTAIFARTDVLGFERMEYELTSDAIARGLDAALPAVFELRDQIGEFGRGERI